MIVELYSGFSNLTYRNNLDINREKEEMTASETNYTSVQASFGPNAHYYTTSTGHNNSASLAELVARVGPNPADQVLDIGTGAGHTAIAFAPWSGAVVAFDLTPSMLEETERNAAASGITNLTTKQGAAENLPFEDGTFDIVVCRYTTHHFTSITQAVAEMARVLKPGGKWVVMDTTVPEDAELDRQINGIDWLRDPSHIRSYSEREWRALAEKAALKVVSVEHGYYDENGKMDFEVWTRRIGTSPANKAKLAEILRAAGPDLTGILQLEVSESKIQFTLPVLTIMAVK
jgi:ubiquinone/menaquinone biosynthesis C-methylase UbiE